MAAQKFIILARHFNTSSLHQALVKPPLAVFGIEGRYATALYSAASKEKKIESIEGELKRLKDILKTDLKLKEFIANPLINKNLKKEALHNTLQKQKFSNLLINLMGSLAENGRLNRLEAVISTYTNIMSAYRGEVLCEVTTAKPLDEVLMKDLQGALQGFMKKGEVLKLQTKVDPSIIGGMLVSVGDKYIDMSTASKIKTYTNLLKEVV